MTKLILADSLFSILLCAAGLFFAAHAPIEDRRAATICAALILVNCIFYNWTWFPYSPHLTLGLKSTAYWSLTDVIVTLVIAEKAIDRWWGLALFLLFCLQISCHVSRSFGVTAFYPYSLALDALGYLQILVFVMIGGKGVRDRLFNIGNHGRNGLDKSKAAQG